MKFLIIILAALINSSINAQYINDSAIANTLLQLEIEFWKTDTDSTRLNVLLKKADTYKSIGMYEKALFELNRAEKYCKNQKELAGLNYQQMLNYFLSGNYTYASAISIPAIELEQNNNAKEYEIMKLVSLNEAEKWEKCKIELLSICSSDDTVIISNIEQLPLVYNYISPEYCSRLSSFMPGLGEIKAGYPLKGITSLLINSGLVFFAGYNFYYGFYATGIVSGVFPFLKFYSGGKRLSSNLAEKHNEKEKKKLKEKYSKITEEMFIH